MDKRVPKAQDMVFIMGITLAVQLHVHKDVSDMFLEMVTKSVRTSSKIVTSIILWLKYAGLFLTTFTATTSCVFIFWHFTT